LVGAFVTLYDVILRYVFNSPSLYASYIVAFLTLGAIFVGMGYSFQSGGQVYIEILVDKLPPLARKVCFTLGYCFGLIFLGAMLKSCWEYTVQAYQSGWVATGNLSFPLVVLYGVMVFGFGLLILTIVANAITMWRGNES
jgi:TRAP-type C4-dicarboxylate transport system permease small subunit